MSKLSPLHNFGNGDAVPYFRQWHDGSRDYVFPVRPKVEYGIALRLGTRVHRIKAAAASVFNGRMHFGARWLCNAYSPDISFLVAPTPAPLCKRCERAKAPSVYRCFDASGRLLYLGHSSNVPVRTSQHALYSPWWPEVARVQAELFATVLEALAAEEDAIRDEHPLHNGPVPASL
jgi:hypothetical protein